MSAKRAMAMAAAGVLVLAAIVVVVLVVRGSGGVRTLGEDDDGAVVEVAVGEQIVLELEGNATTGYTWAVTAVDPAILAPAGDPDYQSESDADGAGGTYTFRFDAVGPGETEVVLKYFPSWEEPSATAGTFTFTAVVD
jgi:inhibitor of cysteine peptidase